MAHRPIFIPGDHKGPLFRELSVQFRWHSGMAPVQKKRSVTELHQEAKMLGCKNVLEVSTKSELEIGRRLSAFVLDVELSGITSKIECVYQGSKVFQKAGPFNNLVECRPIDAKRYFKDKDFGLITHFEFFGQTYENLPFHAFYDWLFLRALSPHKAFLEDNLNRFDAYSDIEFNPSRSINTQARSMAIISSLLGRRQFKRCVEDFDYFRSHLEKIEKKNSTQIELGLAS